MEINNVRKEKRNTMIKHILVWALMTTYLTILDPPQAGTFWKPIFETIVCMFNYVWTFYLLSLFFLPRTTNKIIYSQPRTWVGFIYTTLAMVLVGLGFLIFDYLTFYHILPFAGIENYYMGRFQTLAVISSKAYCMVVAPAFGYFWGRKNIKEIKKRHEMERNLMLKELSFLKNQFHSHITFNFLQFCYNNVFKHSMKAADAIEIFSSMLRYSMHLKSDKEILLSEEIKYIQDFIEIQKVLTSEVYVHFEREGDFENKLILPRILITFVENAFKHGQINDPTHPINIKLSVINGEINFLVENKISRKKQQSSGIGHENVKKLLDIFYCDRYQLNIQKTSETHLSQLILC
jgi:two-component system, LytTR family, sensor kinase